MANFPSSHSGNCTSHLGKFASSERTLMLFRYTDRPVTSQQKCHLIFSLFISACRLDIYLSYLFIYLKNCFTSEINYFSGYFFLSFQEIQGVSRSFQKCPGILATLCLYGYLEHESDVE